MPHIYIPNQRTDREEMMASIGISDVSDLFSSIPDEMKLKRPLALDEKTGEIGIMKKLKALAAENSSLSDHVSFLGAGVYDHHIPSVIDPIVSRAEFYTSYTPYQPEISQGTLQAIFEYQTAMCILTGMDISNASMYDGASALYEACSLAVNHTGINRIILSSGLHPEYIQVVRTGLRPFSTAIVTADDMEAMDELSKEPSSCIVIQNPDFYGNIHDIGRFTEIAGRHGCLSIVFADPLSLGILEPPGNHGADIAIGDGQPLGCYPSLGGPHFGYFCTSTKLMRKIPGRIVGKTKDADGRDGYVLTLQAREQHIRREKASSNICSNHSLCALRALIYLSAVGKEGLYRIAMDCANKAQYLKDALISTGCFEKAFPHDTFREFALRSVTDIRRLNSELFKKGFIGGLHIKSDDLWLLAVTEKRTYEEMDRFITEVKKICEENR